MAGETTSIARPYAEAVFNRAAETDKLELWSEMLEFLSAVVSDTDMGGYIENPTLDRAQLAELMLDIGGGRLNDEGQNLVKLLVQNGRLALLPAITEQFDALKAAAEGTLEVTVTSAFVLNPAQEAQLSEALAGRLGRKVHITSERDPELIGGVTVRAGDLVIDGSVRGQLEQLANKLAI